MTDLKIGVVKFAPAENCKETTKTTAEWGQAETPDPPPQPPPTDREKFIIEAMEHLREVTEILRPHALNEDVDVIGANDAIERAKVRLIRAFEARDHDPVRITIWPEEKERKPRHYDLKEVPDSDGLYQVEGLVDEAYERGKEDGASVDDALPG